MKIIVIIYLIHRDTLYFFKKIIVPFQHRNRRGQVEARQRVSCASTGILGR